MVAVKENSLQAKRLKMYKDKDKQREAVKLATRRYRRRVSHKIGSPKVSQAESVIPGCNNQALDPSILDEFTPRPVKAQSHNPMMVGYVPPQN